MNLPRPFTEVAAGICIREDGAYLVAQRPEGKVYSGYWEFPGGKLEPGESASDALVREMQEELGITPLDFHPWITRIHHYEHASVRLRFFRIRKWHGEFVCREFQRIAWQQPGENSIAPMLPANGPVLRSLALPETLGITQVSALGPGLFLKRLDVALKGGLRMVMLREKDCDESALAAYAHMLLPRCRASGAQLIVNASPETALAAGVEGVHLSAARLMSLHARPDLPLCGASCHDAGELAKAEALGFDYAVLGSVLSTPSHPGQASLGWPKFAELIKDCALPVYALGGMDPSMRALAWGHGAHGLAMMRAAWLSE